MRKLLLVLAVFALVLGACGDKEEAPTDTGVEKPAAPSATVEFACSDPDCTKTKTGTLADPPS